MKALSKKTSLRVPVSARGAAVESELLFQHRSRKVRRTELRAFWKELTRRISPHNSAACLITGDEELRRMNREFRHKDYATDVLSFPSDVDGTADVSPALADGASGIGEIAISFDRAAAQAAELGHSVDDELRILMLHGLLHLTGLDHESDAGEMARVETRWRKKLGLPSGLIERSSRPRDERSEDSKVERSEDSKVERREDSKTGRSEDLKTERSEVSKKRAARR